MANEIKLVTYANSEVTPQNDAVLTNLEIASNGVIFGCNVTIKNASTLHINAGMGVVYGREFEIVDSDIPVSLSSSGTLLGQLYVHIDLANTSEPAQLLVDTGNSLTPLVDDPTINITTGSTDYQLATFTVDTSTLANLTETFSIVDNPTTIIGNTDISGIADGTVTGAIAQINTDLSDIGKPVLLGSASSVQAGIVNITLNNDSIMNYNRLLCIAKSTQSPYFVSTAEVPVAFFKSRTSTNSRVTTSNTQGGGEFFYNSDTVISTSRHNTVNVDVWVYGVK